jgi:hypothetical protein
MSKSPYSQRYVVAVNFDSAIAAVRAEVKLQSDEVNEYRKDLPSEKKMYIPNCTTYADLEKYGGSFFELTGCNNMGPVLIS